MKKSVYSPSATSPTSQEKSSSASTVNYEFELAETIVQKWEEFDGVFLFDVENKKEAEEYIQAVKDIQAAMHFLLAEDSGSRDLVRAQNSMQKAMTRLQKEFHRILSSNRRYLCPESISSRSSMSVLDTGIDDTSSSSEEDEIEVVGDSVSASEGVLSELKMIADTMISLGYAKECVRIYNTIRRSTIDESLYYLGVHKMSSLQIQKLDWEVIEVKIKTWSRAVRVAVTSLFHGEKVLCEHVFSSSPAIAESCFAEIVKEGAMALFGFPNHVAKYKKLSPEKMFRVLDLYEAISELWSDIESIFTYESMSHVRTQAVNTLINLGDLARSLLVDFETAMQKENSKATVPGGGVHPLARYVVNYLIFLSDYSGILTDILDDFTLTAQSPMPESYFLSPVPEDHPSSALSARLAWLILVLLCKLDVKARIYNDVSLSYLFLANNLNYVISKVRTSNLKILLGDHWLYNHESKVKQFASNYVRMGWSNVLSALVPEHNPMAEIPIDRVRECFMKFNSAFDEAYRKQTSWVVLDPQLRDKIKVSIAKKVVPAYHEFYKKYRPLFWPEVGAEAIVRYAPDDLGNYLSDLFYGAGMASGSVTSSPSWSSLHSPRDEKVR